MPPNHATSDLVTVAWVSSIPGLTADGVGTQLPPDDTTWSAHGYIVIPATVGGSPHSTMPLRRPVCQVECWATTPGSNIPPWGKAADLAEQIRYATYDRHFFGRGLTVSLNGVPYPSARVNSVKILTEPHRAYGDQADYAGVSFDIAFQWTQIGELVP
jgi:hypothetical protein